MAQDNTGQIAPRIPVRDFRGGDYFRVHNALVDHYGPSLGVYGLAVYMALCRHAGQEHQDTWVGQRIIAKKLNCSERQVIREMQKLKAAGLILVEELVDARGRGANTYTLLPVPPSDSQSDGSDSQSQGIRHTVTTPVTDSHLHEFNNTQLTKLMEQGQIDPWKAELAATMTASNYYRWVAPLELVELVNHHAVLIAPDAGTADYARTRLADTLARALNVEHIEVQTAKGNGL